MTEPAAALSQSEAGHHRNRSQPPRTNDQAKKKINVLPPSSNYGRPEVEGQVNIVNNNNNNRNNTISGNNNQFSNYNNSSSVELYFAWFSAILFVGQIATDVGVAAYYFEGGYDQWAIITLAIIVVPLVLCQIYSVVLMRSDASVGHHTSPVAACFWHVLLMGIPYRYQDIFCNVRNMSTYQFRYKLQELQAIQTVNAILQYCPQCIFQTFLIAHRHFACLLTAVSAGLACFSFAWHLFLQCYSLSQRSQEEYKITAGPNFTSNFRVNNLENNNSSSLATIITTASTIAASSAAPNGAAGADIAIDFARNLAIDPESSLKKNLQILEKNSLMDNRNLASKGAKNVEKAKIFQFNKRRSIYHEDLGGIHSVEHDTLDVSLEDRPNKSTVYYEMSEDPVKPNMMSGSMDDDLRTLPQLKRKGICSSQEMLHLVDLMNENISADQIDSLEKSLMDLNGFQELQSLGAGRPMGAHEGGGESANSVTSEDSTKMMFKCFPQALDESVQSSILENIDAAIYENQIIFQERIKKNQLTIQNLKLQDQLLSQFMELHLPPTNENIRSLLAANLESSHKLLSLDSGNGIVVGPRPPNGYVAGDHGCLTRCNDDHEDADEKHEHDTSLGYLSSRDYENMCFVNIARNVHKLKHWRNYMHTINSSQHDGSTALNSSYFVNTTTATTSNSAYTNTGIDEGGTHSSSVYGGGVGGGRGSAFSHEKADDLYMIMAPVQPVSSSAADDKNILVETISQINDSSPLKLNGLENGTDGHQRAIDDDFMAIECGAGGIAAGRRRSSRDDQEVGRLSKKLIATTPSSQGSRAYPGCYYYAMGGNNSPLDSILENISEDCA